MDDTIGEVEAADPARAFEDLRAEVSVLRRAVEGLPRAWAENRAPDYSVDLGRIGKTLGVVADRLQAIETHPALIMTPEEHRRAIVQAGHAVTADSAAEGVDRARRQLAALIGVVRTREQQLRVLAIAAGIAFAVGLVLSPLAAGGLPFGLNGRVAALVMHDGGRGGQGRQGSAVCDQRGADELIYRASGGLRRQQRRLPGRGGVIRSARSSRRLRRSADV